MNAQSLLSAADQFFLWTVPFLLVLGVVVIVHELGHFLAARALGITVETFSVGFGPEIAGFHDRSGTRWRIAWIPLGGYVKFKGDETVASLPSREKLETLTAAERAGNFHTSALWRRTLIVLAGPMANFLLCIVIFTGWFMSTGIVYREARITCVQPNSPASQAGILAGDKVMAVSGSPIADFDDFRRSVILNARSEINLLIDRGGQSVMLHAVPQLTERECVGQLGVVGPGPQDEKIRRLGFAQALRESGEKTWLNIEMPFRFLGQLFRGNACSTQLGGPAKIAEVSKDAASAGIIYLIPLIAFISVSVGLFNLFPIPILDGGHLLFYSAEAILGRPLSQRAQEIGFQIGFTSLLMLMIFVTWNNVSELAHKETTVVKADTVCHG